METVSFKPCISVVITAYNAGSTVLATLHALDQQTAPRDRFEVILVDDGSTDDTKQIVERFASQSSLPLTYVYQPNKGVGAARNFGVRHAKGDILAFTDADCTCDADWIEVIAQEIRKQKKKLIGGCTYSHDTIIFPRKMAPVHHIGVTANLAVDRSVFATDEMVFTNEFLWMLGHDIDLVVSLEEKGYHLEYIAHMRVQHPANILSFERFLMRARSRGNEVGLYKKHREKVLWAFSPMMQPRIGGRISYLFLGCVVLLVAMIGLGCWWGWEAVVVSGLVGCVWFLLYGYRYLILYTPPHAAVVSWSDRVRTLCYLALFLPLFCYHRIRGSIHFGFLML